MLIEVFKEKALGDMPWRVRLRFAIQLVSFIESLIQ